jgi:hypothetical protein
VFFADGSGAEVPLAQPVRTNAAGNPVNPAGAPVQIRVQVNPADTAYSFLAQTDGGAQVLYQSRIEVDAEQLAAVAEVVSLKSLPTIGMLDGEQFSVGGFYAGSTIGGGMFVWRASQNKSTNNGVTVYAPEAISLWDGTQAGLSAMFSWSGGGSGVFVRVGVSVITPQMAGAVANSSANSKPSFDACIQHLSSVGGGELFCPAGIYDFHGALVISSPSISIVGASRFSFLIRQKTLNSPTIIVNGNFFQARSFSVIYDGVAIDGGAAISISAGSATLEDFVIRSCHTGVKFEGLNATAGKMSDFEILDYEYCGLFLRNMNDLFVRSFIMNAGNDSRGSAGGIRLAERVEAFICSDGDILKGQYAMTIDATNYSMNTRPAYNNFTNVFFDSARNSVLIDNCVETEFVGCWFSGGRFGGGAAGCLVGRSSGIRFTNTRFFNCGAHGVIVSADADDTSFVNCKAESNSVTSGVGVSHGFFFNVNAKNFKVIGCSASNGLYTGKQRSGVFISTGCTNFIVRDNYLMGNEVSAIADGSASTAVKFISGNVGYTTQSKGAATILSETSSIVVTHGLSAAPQLSDIQVSLASTPNGGESFFASAPNSTSFTINSASAVTANTVVTWSIRISGA